MADKLMRRRRKHQQGRRAAGRRLGARLAGAYPLAAVLCALAPSAPASQDVATEAKLATANASQSATKGGVEGARTSAVRVEVQGNRVSLLADKASLRQILQAVADATGFSLRFLSGYRDTRISTELIDLTLRETFVRLLKDYHHVIVAPDDSKDLEAEMLIVGSRAAAASRLDSPREGSHGAGAGSLSSARAALLDEVIWALPVTDKPVAKTVRWVTPPAAVQEQVENALHAALPK